MDWNCPKCHRVVSDTNWYYSERNGGTRICIRCHDYENLSSTTGKHVEKWEFEQLQSRVDVLVDQVDYLKSELQNARAQAEEMAASPKEKLKHIVPNLQVEENRV